MPGPLITLSSDFGSASAFAAMLRGALLARCPEARILDLSHELAAGDVFAAALLLLRVYSYYPARTVHLLALDRGTGPDRVLVAEAGGQFFLALDHGGLGLVLENEPQARVRAVELQRRTTFVARDAMVDLAVAVAQRPEQLPGQPVSDWQRLELPRPRVVGGGAEGEMEAEVLWVDSFGNLVLSARAGAASWVEAEVGEARVRRWDGHYGDAPAGALALLRGAEGWMEIALPGGSAAARLRVGRGARVRLR